MTVIGALIEGLYTLWKPDRSPIYPKLPTCSFCILLLWSYHLAMIMTVGMIIEDDDETDDENDGHDDDIP